MRYSGQPAALKSSHFMRQGYAMKVSSVDIANVRGCPLLDSSAFLLGSILADGSFRRANA